MKIANFTALVVGNFQANFGIIFMPARHDSMTREFTFSQRNYEHKTTQQNTIFIVCWESRAK